jgi:pyruvate dehydrogenase E2 component (dihydrolipoamide acetyltransferase)
MLKAVAARMAHSKQTVPHFYVESEIDMTRALELRKELNDGLDGERCQRQRPDRARLRDGADRHPQAHRSYVDGRHAYHAHANVGIAVALDDGLIVPVLREADTKSVRQISRETKDLVAAARDGQLRPARDRGRHLHRVQHGHVRRRQLRGHHQPARIRHPGRRQHRPPGGAGDGDIRVRSLMRVTLSCDHRACSGADGAKLLQSVKRYLQAPSLLLA